MAAYAHLNQNGWHLPEFEQFKQTGFELLPVRWQRAARGQQNLTVADLLADALQASRELERKGVFCTVVNARFVKPLDRAAILQAAGSHERLVTVEENAVAGGAGSAVNEVLAAENLAVPVLNLGLADTFLQHGTREEVLHLAGLDREGILASVQRFIGDAPSGAGAAARVS